MKLSKQHLDKIHHFFSGLPVKKAYLFGSYSRNEVDRDVDILVEACNALTDESKTTSDYISLLE